MSLKIENGLIDLTEPTKRFPVAITSHKGQLFLSVAVRFAAPAWMMKRKYRGQECYQTIAVTSVPGGIDMAAFDDAKMAAANWWYPKEIVPQGFPAECGGYIERARAALHRHVVIILEKKSAMRGPLHRISAGGLDKKRVAH